MKIASPLFKFAWQSRKNHVRYALLAAFVVLILALRFSESLLLQNAPPVDAAVARNEVRTWVWTLIDRVVTFSTLAVAIAVWLGEVREEWERRLPRRLFAYFLYRERPVAVCLGANLAADHDARALAQQLAAQIWAFNRPQQERHNQPEVGFQTSTPSASSTSDGDLVRQILEGTRELREMLSKPQANKSILWDMMRVETHELEIANTAHEPFKPIKIVFRLTDKKQVDDLKLTEDHTFVWIPGKPKPECFPGNHSFCKIPTNRLSAEVIKAVIGLNEPAERQFHATPD